MRNVKNKGKIKEQLAKRVNMLYAAPATIFFVLFAIVPLLMAFVLSFCQWNSGIGTPKFVGLDNWTSIFGSEGASVPYDVYKSLWITVKVIIITVLVETPISMLFGVWMAKQTKFRSVLSVIFFFPLLFSSAAVSIIFLKFFDPYFGLSSVLPFFPQNVLGADMILYTIMFVICWIYIPFHALLYQGGVRQIPNDMYEAAKLDGVSDFKAFFYITLPQLKYTIITSITLQIVGSLTYFDLFYIMAQRSSETRVLPLLMYMSYQSGNWGKACVLGSVIAILGLVISLTINRVTGSSKMESQMEGV
ncbi:MAG: sugar ABC transporter permease [Clostridiales Family XIII bacterium]|jgi:raffinose/stachyose/melibiose transport system permease protein|nr:sugar ABC transporter permease [Clostridiales Family XIII bacterium]